MYSDSSKLSENSTIKIRVYAKHRMRGEELVGEGDCSEHLSKLVGHKPGEESSAYIGIE
jgi:hypothetical protein